MKMNLNELRIGQIYDKNDVNYQYENVLNEQLKILKNGKDSIVVTTVGLDDDKFRVVQTLIEKSNRKPLF